MKSGIFIFSLLLLVGLSSCKKEKEAPENLLTGKEWIYEKLEIKTGTGDWMVMPLQLLFPCVTGAKLQFTDDHVVIPTPGAASCDDLEDINFLGFSTWQLAEGDKKLIIDGDNQLNIEVLNKTTLVLSGINPDQPDELNRVTFKR